MICQTCGACCVGQVILVRLDDNPPALMVDGHEMRRACGLFGLVEVRG